MAAALGAAVALVANACARGPDLAAPVGTRSNPVLCSGKPDEFDYLARLRCPDGSVPRWRRSRGVRGGPYGGALDRYRVRCVNDDWEAAVYFDRRHRPLDEERAPPGLTLAPAAAAPSCRIPGRCH